jgi:hypothetical protein
MEPAEEGLPKFIHKAFKFSGGRHVKNFLHGTYALALPALADNAHHHDELSEQELGTVHFPVERLRDSPVCHGTRRIVLRNLLESGFCGLKCEGMQ